MVLNRRQLELGELLYSHRSFNLRYEQQDIIRLYDLCNPGTLRSDFNAVNRSIRARTFFSSYDRANKPRPREWRKMYQDVGRRRLERELIRIAGLLAVRRRRRVAASRPVRVSVTVPANTRPTWDPDTTPLLTPPQDRRTGANMRWPNWTTAQASGGRARSRLAALNWRRRSARRPRGRGYTRRYG